jgi:GNAT superfamily N-acetyltransferase
MKVRTEEVSSKHWPALERLFGANGACGGCWCMYWRTAKGESWDANKGATNKRRFKKLIAEGRAHGVLAFVDDEPVGWLAYDRRADFVRLERARTLACDDVEKVWSLPCFFVKAGMRGKGIATALLKHALKSLRAEGAEVAEAYPVNPRKPGEKIPAAFAYTGTTSLFAREGFRVVGNKGGGRQRMRRTP